MSSHNPTVFISYRRIDKDGRAASKRIYERLAGHLGKEAVIFDTETIPQGADFAEYVDEKIRTCYVLLAVIGDEWLEIENHQPRIKNEDDWVRVELEAAMRHNLQIIPVLACNAEMPKKKDMPKSLHPFLTKNAAPLRDDQDGSAHLDRLVASIDGFLALGRPPRWPKNCLRAALVIGIDEYEATHLEPTGCVEDAKRISSLLRRHSSGDRNFKVSLSQQNTSPETLMEAIKELFALKTEVALLYFAGHAQNEESGYLLTREEPGIAFTEVITLANKSISKERIIILDCCSSNRSGELFARNKPLSLSEGISILAVQRRKPDIFVRWVTGSATSLMCDALEDGGADLTGSVTIADLYNQINASGCFDQRSYFRANLATVSSIRSTKPSVENIVLKNITKHFKTPDTLYKLSPAYEPTAEPKSKLKETKFAELQKLTKARLVEPAPPHEHMYFAAMENGACRLTNLGHFYWLLCNAGRFDKKPNIK